MLIKYHPDKFCLFYRECSCTLTLSAIQARRLLGTRARSEDRSHYAHGCRVLEREYLREGEGESKGVRAGEGERAGAGSGERDKCRQANSGLLV